MTFHWRASLPGGCVVVVAVVALAAVAVVVAEEAAEVAAAAESGPAARGCGCVGAGYGCVYCYGC